MDSRKVFLATIATFGVIAAFYLFLQGKIAFDEYTHWKSREAVLEKELEQLREEAKNHREFLDGAKKAFEIIISSFNNGDKKTLKNLVSKDVYSAFEKAIDEKTNNPESQFYSLIVEGIADAKVENDTISISVNFISEQMLNNDEGSIVKNKDTWTFEKPVNSSSPIWILTQT